MNTAKHPKKVRAQGGRWHGKSWNPTTDDAAKYRSGVALSWAAIGRLPISQ